MTEVIAALVLDDEAAGGEFLERRRDLLLGAATDGAEVVGVERATEDRRGAQDLRRHVADRVEARLEHRAHAAGGGAVDMTGGGDQLRDEQGQPFALTEHPLGFGLVEPGFGGELEDIPAGQASECDPFPERRQPGVAMFRVGFVVAASAQKKYVVVFQPARAVRERIEGRRIAPLEVVDEHDTRGR